mgnify:CR=1 FL=1
MADFTLTGRKVSPALIALALAVTIAILVSAGSQMTLAQLTSTTEQRGATRNMRIDLAELMSTFKDLETGARGFALTGDERFLEPFHFARIELPSRYAKLKRQMEGQIPPGIDWAEFENLMHERIALSARLVETRREQGHDAAAAGDLIGRGKVVMDKLRALVGQLDQDIGLRIAAIGLDVERIRARATWLGWGASGAIAVLIGVSVFLLLSERRARQRLEANIRAANQNLERRVANRTAELAAAKARIARFAADEEQRVEAERHRISREVHDQIGAVFTGIKLILRGLPAGSVSADQEKALLGAIDMGVATARRIASELRPPLIDDLGLQPALEQMLENAFRGANTRYAVRLKRAELLSPRQTLAAYRIVQEAGTNVLRHAQAAHFAVNGEPAGDGLYRITMMDDGIGMTAVEPRTGALGMTGMRERAEWLGGRLDVTSEPHGGVTLVLTLPLIAEGKGGR